MKQSHKDLQRYLMASYLYYCRMESIMPDTEYDKIAKELLGNYDDWQDHIHSYLVDKEDLEAGTLYKLKAKDYPALVRAAAETWMRALDKAQDAV